MDEMQNSVIPKNHPFHRDKYVLISVALLIFSIVFFFVAPFAPVYWLRLAHLNAGNMLISNWPGGLSCISLTIIGGLWFFAAFYLIDHTSDEMARIAVMCLLALTTLIAIVGSIVGFFFIVGLRPLVSTSFMNHRYHLESWTGFDSTNYTLLQCNQLDFNCKRIESIPGELYFDLPDSELVANSETNTLAVIINGETIYTYMPE